MQLALEESGGAPDDLPTQDTHESGADLPGKTIVPSGSDTVTERTGMMIGRYKLLQQIGEGGMGVVYMTKAKDSLAESAAALR